MLDNGVYRLSFQRRGAEGSEYGDGLAVVRDGRILGSDRFGGVFAGCCRLDPAGGGSLVQVQLAMPPHAVLLTGFEAGPQGTTLEITALIKRPAPVSKGIVEVAGEAIEVELMYVGPLAS